MNRKRIVLVTVAAIAAGGVVWRMWAGPAVATVPSVRRGLEKRVVASGVVLSPARVELGVLVLGRVARVNVVAGDRVVAGQLLVELEHAEAEAALARATADVSQARARLDAQRRVASPASLEAVRQARLREEQAARQLADLATLSEKGAVRARDVDDAHTALAVAESERRRAEVQAAGNLNVTGDVAALASSEAALAQARARLAETHVVAPTAGVVLERAVEPGDIVQPGRAVLILARDGDTQIRANPDERTLALLTLGQEATVTADAFPDRPFAARLVSLAPAVDADRGTIEIKLAVPAPPPILRPGMTVSVAVNVGRRDDALVLPAGAVRDSASARPWVLVAQGGHAVRKDIRIGLSGDGELEVVAGLGVGELVIPPASGPIRVGQRLRAR